MSQPEEAAGLSSAQAAALQSKFGPNEVAPSSRRSAIVEFLKLFLNPLVLILLAAGAISAFLGQGVSASIIFVMVLLGVAINFVQTYRSERAAQRLRDSVAPTATVLRDGAWSEIRRAELVPGDLVRLTAGDMVPADADLVAMRDLHLHEAALTGESIPVAKEMAGDKVFLGTSVVSGTATARVTATGRATAFGEIAQRLQIRPEETEFDRGLRQFGMLILRATIFLVLFLLVVSAAMRRDFLESLLFAVALAVGLTPEFLPVITSATLARGAERMWREGVIVKRLSAIQDLGSIDILCSDKTGTLTSGVMELINVTGPTGEPSETALLYAYLNSQHETGIHSPFDVAILKRQVPAAQGYRKLDEIPFDFERRVVSIVVEGPDHQPLLIAKGAPEAVLSRCAGLDQGLTVRCHELCQKWSTDGIRLLAVAHRAIPPGSTFSVADERDLTLDGFLGFADTPLSDSTEALADLHRDGITLKILTGDDPLVARHVCVQVGLLSESNTEAVVLGDDIAKLDDIALAHVAEQATVFARLSPAQKNRILIALKHRGHVVGYLGDGINDAPSLHAADVGIAAAQSTDVAREASDIVLARSGLRVLHTGVMEGRRASANLQKYLLMGTSSNFGNMLSMAAATAFLPFLPMLPTQILLNNFLYDLSQITIPLDYVDAEYLRAPQRWNLKLIRNFMLLVGPISSIYDFLTFYVLLRVFHAPEKEFHTGWFVESLATQTLVLFVIRTAGNPFRSRPHPVLAATIAGVVLLALALPFTPLGAPLGFVPLPAAYYGFLGLATLTYLGLVQIAKNRVVSMRPVS